MNVSKFRFKIETFPKQMLQLKHAEIQLRDS